MNDRLDEIRGLLASVTPGRWRWQDHGNGMYLGSDEDVVVGTITRYVGVSGEEVVDVEPFGEADAEILAAAPELLAWCVAEIERLRAELALLRRCRDAVLRLGGRRDHATELPWWLAIDDDGLCVGCGSRVWGHAADCPALAIDELAKEVRGE